MSMDSLAAHGCPPASARTRLRTVLIVLTVACLGGCNLGTGSAGQLRSSSLRNDGVTLPSEYTVAVFSNDKIAGTSILLSDVPIDELLKGDVRNGQIMHIELLWVPKAGATPMDPSATNASIRHIIISNGQVGIYGGAGFALPSENPSHRETVTFTLRDASLSLQESTAGFEDLLTPSQMTGTFSVVRDDKKARQLYFATSQLVTNAFGRTRYVLIEDTPNAAQLKTPEQVGGWRDLLIANR